MSTTAAAPYETLILSEPTDGYYCFQDYASANSGYYFSYYYNQFNLLLFIIIIIIIIIIMYYY